MTCPQCKTDNIEEAMFCRHCGAKIREEPEPIL
ncbi:MAG: zinc-ribbon domain-containing protein, partial [Elusimicrobia bacterium]|nr:zinc-ribbon domain-containing protein [Elusimicrobiota bacterium]MBD3412551.1 zinc-ribbon domain-containing protein [Elusimicrobiota bacterium]